MEECGEQRERDLTERLTTSSILEVILGAYVRMHVCKVSAKQMWGSEGKVR